MLKHPYSNDLKDSAWKKNLKSAILAQIFQPHKPLSQLPNHYTKRPERKSGRRGETLHQTNGSGWDAVLQGCAEGHQPGWRCDELKPLQEQRQSCGSILTAQSQPEERKRQPTQETGRWIITKGWSKSQCHPTGTRGQDRSQGEGPRRGEPGQLQPEQPVRLAAAALRGHGSAEPRCKAPGAARHERPRHQPPPGKQWLGPGGGGREMQRQTRCPSSRLP